MALPLLEWAETRPLLFLAVSYLFALLVGIIAVHLMYFFNGRPKDDILVFERREFEKKEAEIATNAIKAHVMNRAASLKQRRKQITQEQAEFAERWAATRNFTK